MTDRIWSAEQTKIENGTWHDQAPKTITFETVLKQYREYSTSRIAHTTTFETASRAAAATNSLSSSFV